MAKLLQKLKKQIYLGFSGEENIRLYVRGVSSECLPTQMKSYLCHITFPGYLQARGLEVGGLLAKNIEGLGAPGGTVS